METAARARGLAGRTRRRALGDSVSVRRVAAAEVPRGYARITARSGRVPRLRDRPLRMPAKMMRSGAQRAILIATQLLDIELTSSQQTRKHFLIASFSAVSAQPPHLADRNPRTAPFLFNTNKPHRIITLTRTPMKTKEKGFSIQHKFTVTNSQAQARGFNRKSTGRIAYATGLAIFFLQLALEEIFHQGFYALGEEFLEMGS